MLTIWREIIKKFDNTLIRKLTVDRAPLRSLMLFLPYHINHIYMRKYAGPGDSRSSKLDRCCIFVFSLFLSKTYGFIQLSKLTFDRMKWKHEPERLNKQNEINSLKLT
jgi:hypothetical protein